MSHSFVLSFKEGIALVEQSDGHTLLRSQSAQVPLMHLSPGLLAALRILSSAGATIEQLGEVVIQHDGITSLSKLLSYLDCFTKKGLLCQTVTWSRGKLATLVPPVAIPRCIPNKLANGTYYVLSRFAYLHRDGENFILASPLAHAHVLLHDWRAVALLHALAQPTNLQKLAQVLDDLPDGCIVGFVQLLLSCRILVRLSDEGFSEEEHPTLSQWDFHDLLFHTKSRMGGYERPYGATFRFLGKIEPLPAVKHPMSNMTTCLYTPDVESLKDNDVPFTRVLEERRSIRTHGEESITLLQLGEFLYRTARIRTLTGAAETGYERTNRPYPSGGACYELEMYVAVNSCTGLSPGLYHYCPKEHQLHLLVDRTRELDTLLEQAYGATGQIGKPQILIVLSARFQRIAWKYEAMAYAAILKNVGALYQTMYLVATAMGLAACALGGGNSDTFAAVAGIDYYTETSVGEFLLGSGAKR